MVEPQESNTRSKMLADQQIFATNLIKNSSEVPEEMIGAAEIKLIVFNALKVEIDSNMAKVHDALDEVRKKIRENSWSEENKESLLTCKQEDYL